MTNGSFGGLAAPPERLPAAHDRPVPPALEGTAPRSGTGGWIHATLLLATLATTTWAGAMHQGVNILSRPSEWTRGLPYALALLVILGVHEMGHFVMARRRGVRVSLPYFIPAPIWLGTFGAFIKMRGAIRDRATYLDVGIAGPLAGLAVAVAALFLGLLLERPTVVAGHGLSPGSSFLFAGVYRLAGGTAFSATVQLGPIAFAGWLGLMVTALNLFPVGQLDGGHIAYAALGPVVARVLSGAVIALLVGGGLLLGSHLTMWGFIVWLIAGISHPPAEDEGAPIGRGRKMLAASALLLLVAILVPLPSAL